MLLTGGKVTYSYAQPLGIEKGQANADVPPGMFEMPFVGKTNQKSISAKVTFKKLQTKTRWAPSAFVGFQSADEKTQFKAFLTQHNPGDTTLLAGYQLVVNGIAQTPKMLANKLPLHESILITANRIANGGVQIQIAGSNPVVIGNSTSELMPFIVISSVVANVTWSVQ